MLPLKCADSGIDCICITLDKNKVLNVLGIAELQSNVLLVV